MALKRLTLPLLRQAIVCTYQDNQSEYNELRIAKQEYSIFKDHIEKRRDKSGGKHRKSVKSDGIRGDPKFLLNTIKTIFSSRESLDQSFLETINHSHPSKIDFGSLRTSYKLIMDLPPYDLFVSTLSNALEILLARIEMDPHMLERDESSLRQLFIVIECPLLTTFSGDACLSMVLVKRLVRILGNIADLQGKSRNRLIRWFSK